MYFSALKRILYLMLICTSSINMLNARPVENQQEEDNHTGEIKEAIVQVKGLVGTASTTGVINALESIKGVAKVIVTDFKQGRVRVILSENNDLSFINFRRQIIKNIESSQCLCDAIKEIITTGMIEKDEFGFFLHVGGSDDKMYLTNKTKGFKKFNTKIKNMYGNRSFVSLVGKIHGHPGGIIAIDSIRKLNALK